MIDHHEARAWAEHRGDYSAAVVTLLREVRQAFRVLARIQYDRPWLRTQRLR